MTNETKLIRVLDRKTIPTSRGTCRGPIGPYRENLNRILVLISRGYNVVEVLPDNSEIKLNEINFDKDNTIIDVDDTSDESLGDTSEEVNTNNTNNSNQNNTKNENAQPPETNRQLSKKERRQKAREQREQQNRANVNNNESSNTEKNEDVKPDSDVVPESAIEE